MDDQEAQERLQAWMVGREMKALLERVLDAAFQKPVNRHERRKAKALARRTAR